MKKAILGAILTAGAVLAQTTGTATPAKSGSAPAGTAATSNAATHTKTKKHHKGHKGAAANKAAVNATKPAK